jgi:hypothetical protein
MSKKGRPTLGDGPRVNINTTISKEADEVISAMARRLGISKGQVIDRLAKSGGGCNE